MSTPKNLPKKTFNEITSIWQNIQTMDIKNKIKALRQLSFDIINSYDKNQTTIEQLDCYIEILRATSRLQSDQANVKRSLSKLIADKLKLSGSENAKILKQISGKLTVESGAIMFGDPAITIPTLSDYSEKELLPIINSKQRFIFNTGGDGIFNIQLRIIEAAEPILTAKEYKYIKNSSQTANIEISSGKIMIGDLHYIDKPAADLACEIEPGSYKISVMIYDIPNKLFSYYIVLCKTNDKNSNDLKQIDLLE